jgi:hypothetical protein
MTLHMNFNPLHFRLWQVWLNRKSILVGVSCTALFALFVWWKTPASASRSACGTIVFQTLHNTDHGDRIYTMVKIDNEKVIVRLPNHIVPVKQGDRVSMDLTKIKAGGWRVHNYRMGCG